MCPQEGVLGTEPGDAHLLHPALDAAPEAGRPAAAKAGSAAFLDTADKRL